MVNIYFIAFLISFLYFQHHLHFRHFQYLQYFLLPYFLIYLRMSMMLTMRIYLKPAKLELVVVLVTHLLRVITQLYLCLLVSKILLMRHAYPAEIWCRRWMRLDMSPGLLGAYQTWIQKLFEGPRHLLLVLSSF